MISVSNSLSSPDFGPVVARDINAARVVDGRTRPQRVCEHRQVRPDVDLDTSVELLDRPIYHRVLLRTRPLDTDQVATVLELAFCGLRRDPSRNASSQRGSSMLNASEATR